jgi:Rieske Fe-S protein
VRKLKNGEVISLDELAQLTRRDFCRGAAAGVALAVLPGCESGTGFGRLGVGGFFDNGDGGLGGAPPDLARTIHHPPDLAQPQHGPPDLSQPQQGPPDLTMPTPPDLTMPVQSNCPAGVLDSGVAPASVALNTATFLGGNSIFVCRDGGGIYALTSSCTHQGCDVSFRGSSFHCPCHGAVFSFNGDAVSGPTNGPLVHFPLCLTAGGTVGVDSNNTVDPSTRYNF